MSTQEDARESMAHQRQQQDHQKQTMHSRLAEELNQPDESHIEEQAREALVRQRQHEEHQQQTMQSRAAEEIGLPSDADHSSPSQ